MKIWHWVGLAALALWLWQGRSAPMPIDALEYFDARAPASTVHTPVRAGCDRGRCLTIYLAPWCSVCRQSHQAVLALAEAMRTRGIPTSVVLGMDTPETLRGYAAEFPFPFYLDPDKRFFAKTDGRGVPYFMTWEANGKVLAEFAGGGLSVTDMTRALALE